VDGQPNDRLGRSRRQRQPKHGRQILRRHVEPNSDANGDSDTYSYSHAQWDSRSNTNGNAKSHTNSEIQSNAAVSP